MPECFYVNNWCFFELMQQLYHATEFGNVANAAIVYIIKTIVLGKVNNRGTQS